MTKLRLAIVGAPGSPGPAPHRNCGDRPAARSSPCTPRTRGPRPLRGPSGPDSAAAVAATLAGQGAQHVYRGEVWDAEGRPGWRVTGLGAARS